MQANLSGIDRRSNLGVLRIVKKSTLIGRAAIAAVLSQAVTSLTNALFVFLLLLPQCPDNTRQSSLVRRSGRTLSAV